MRLNNLVESFIAKIPDENSHLSSDIYSKGIRQFGNKRVYFSQEMEVSFKEILDEIATHHQLGQKLSSSFIETELKKSLARILTNNESLKIELEDLIQRLVSLKFNSRVFLPISGLRSEIEVIKLGQYEFIQNPTGSLAPEILNFLNKIAPEETTDQPSTQNQFAAVIARNIAGKLTLVINLNVEPNKAVESANIEGRMIINVLKLYLDPLVLIRNSANLYIGGRPLNYIDSLLVFDTLNLSISYQSSLIGSTQETFLNDEKIEEFKRLDIDKLLSIITPGNQSDFNDKLLRAILWFVEGASKERKSDQILSLVIALECVMKPRNTMVIKDSTVENVAVLIGNDLAERREIIKHLKELIDLRNGVAHGSGTMDISDVKIELFFSLVRRVIFRLINYVDRKKSMEEVHNELTNERLTPA